MGGDDNVDKGGVLSKELDLVGDEVIMNGLETWLSISSIVASSLSSLSPTTLSSLPCPSPVSEAQSFGCGKMRPSTSYWTFELHSTSCGSIFLGTLTLIDDRSNPTNVIVWL